VTGAERAEAAEVRLTAWMHGQVQGVGMRWWVRSRALEAGLVGWARNTDDGRVEVVAEGSQAAAAAFLVTLRDGPGRPGRVSGVNERWSKAQGGLSGFMER
jgi:acylphosphatase